jgi:hypothetical protein
MGYYDAMYNRVDVVTSLPSRQNYFLAPLNSAWNSGMSLGVGFEDLSLGTGDVDAQKISEIWSTLHDSKLMLKEFEDVADTWNDCFSEASHVIPEDIGTDMNSYNVSSVFNHLLDVDEELRYYKSLFKGACVVASICSIGVLGWKLYCRESKKSSSMVSIGHLFGL